MNVVGKRKSNVGTVKSIWLMIMNLVIVRSMMSKGNKITTVLYTKGGLMLPKRINPTDFIKFCEGHNYVINIKTNHDHYTPNKRSVREVFHEYNDYVTAKDISKNIHSIIEKEIDLYEKVSGMTPRALADHITTKLLSDSGLELLKKFIELKED